MRIGLEEDGPWALIPEGNFFFEISFAECCGLALGKDPLCRVSGMALGKVFLFFFNFDFKFFL